MKQMVMWEHPILGAGQYWRQCETPQDAAEECADIFAGQSVKIRSWDATKVSNINVNKPDYEINNG